MKNFLKMTRGAIPESLVRSILNKNLQGIAEVLEFELDQTGTTGRMKLQLAGEDQPLSIYVNSYTFKREGKRATIQVGSMKTDRAWLQAVLERFVIGKTFRIPDDRVELADGLLG